MKENQKYTFVEDIRGIKLSPTKEEKAWYKIRKGKAKLIQLKPMRIQLLYKVDNTDDSEFYLGLDTGQTTGIAIVQKCETINKVIFKGEIAHRKDVNKLMTKRAHYRRLRRIEKRYRPVRFNNRATLKRKGRLSPSIKTRQDEILRFINKINMMINITSIIIEDVNFNIKSLIENHKTYEWRYLKNGRMDENLRKATLTRDDYTCQLCKTNNTKLHVHHITPRRQNGENTIGNLITLCSKCHDEIKNKEDDYKELFYNITKGKQIGLRYASHVMQGKTYLRKELKKIVSTVELTDSATTSSRRIDWNIEKSHSNDAVVITGLKPDRLDLYEYLIKPLRKKRQTKIDNCLYIVQGDRVYYTPRGKNKIECYVRAIRKTGTKAGYYNLKGYNGKEYGPAPLNKLIKISREKGITIT